MSYWDRSDAEELIMKRDGLQRFYCGYEDNSTVEHLIPLSEGGTYYGDNVVRACYDCN